MKKFLVLTAVLLVLIAVICEKIVPRTVESVLEEQIVNATSSTAVDVSLSATPNFKIAMGEIDKIHATAAAGRIGEIDFKNITLDGEKIRLDIPELLFPNKELSGQERQRKILKRADKLELHGIITAEEIKDFIAAKGDKFEDTKVSITPESASATAKVKFLGRTVDLDIAGVFLVNDGDIYFHMTHLNSNSILSRVNADTFMVDVKVLESTNLPLGLKFDSVELRDGEAVVTAISTVK